MFLTKLFHDIVSHWYLGFTISLRVWMLYIAFLGVFLLALACYKVYNYCNKCIR